MRIFQIIILFVSSVSCLSCKKFLDIPEPLTQTPNGSVFANDAAALSALNGLYSELSRINLSISNGGTTLYASLAADETENTSPNEDLDAFYLNTIPPTNSTGLARLWTQGYKNIYHANSILEGVEQSASLTDSLKKQLQGEALVVRSLHYFLLLNFFGDVPMVLSTEYKSNSLLPRMEVGEIYLQLEKDLLKAKSLLPVWYSSANRARPNQFMAAALLARLYLYMEEWTKAEQEATVVLQSGYYSLAPIGNVFLPSSPETIWQLVRDNNNTAEGALFNPSSSTVRPAYALSAFLLSSFIAGDLRKANWTKQNTVAGQAYYYPYKYKVRLSTPITEYYVVCRLAEIYLIRAEARVRQNNITGCQSDLLAVRQRAGLAAVVATDLSGLLAAIENERQAELFTEWGHRWFDLKRWKRADAVLGVHKAPNWQSTDQLFPIPQTELEVNPFLVQNPGY